MDNLEYLKTINTFRRPLRWTVLERQSGKVTARVYYQCPTCKEMFKMAPRCPECGQLVTKEKFGKVHKKPVEA